MVNMVIRVHKVIMVHMVLGAQGVGCAQCAGCASEWTMSSGATQKTTDVNKIMDWQHSTTLSICMGKTFSKWLLCI